MHVFSGLTDGSENSKLNEYRDQWLKQSCRRERGARSAHEMRRCSVRKQYWQYRKKRCIAMKRYRWDKKYLYWGVTAFLVIAACIVFYMLVSNLGWLQRTVQQLTAILSPFVWGFVIAYLLYPVMKIYNRCLFVPLCNLLLGRSGRAETLAPKVARGLSVFLSIITLLVVVGALLWMVVPQLYTSVETIVLGSTDYLRRADAWLTRMLEDYPEVEAAVTSLFGDLSDGLFTWMQNNLLPEFRGLITAFTVNVYNVVRSIYNIIIGIIVSVYLLYSKEHFCARCKKVVYCIFSLEASERLISGINYTNDVFMGFISGKILDSLIIAILCYIGCIIMGIPYALLVSFIIGLTNIIPFFGPFIGAIPSALIILTVSGWKMLFFIIFVLVLQQFDGNVLGPKILGNRVGVNGFWVMFSIIVGAGLFGFAGMLLGVPVFVVIYTFFRNLVNRKLARSDLPVETEAYVDISHIDPRSGETVTRPPKEKRSSTGLRGWLARRKAQNAAPSEEAPEPQETQTDAPAEDTDDTTGD